MVTCFQCACRKRRCRVVGAMLPLVSLVSLVSLVPLVCACVVGAVGAESAVAAVWWLCVAEGAIRGPLIRLGFGQRYTRRVRTLVHAGAWLSLKHWFSCGRTPRSK